MTQSSSPCNAVREPSTLSPLMRLTHCLHEVLPAILKPVQPQGFTALVPSSALSDSIPADATSDWEILFNAVRARLRNTASEQPVEATVTALQQALSHVRSDVLDCDQALNQLQALLAQEARQRQRLESQVMNAQNALTQAQADLVGAQAEERIVRHLASHDDLTSLPNRIHFREQFDDALIRAQTHGQALALFYLDLDDFKTINDTHGHSVGDELLRIVAVRLTRVVRTNDLLARLGGDEFACLLIGMPTRAQLGQVAGKLFDAISAPLKIGKLRITIRPSIGIAEYAEENATADVLFRMADAAMYRAKQQRLGYAFVDDTPQIVNRA